MRDVPRMTIQDKAQLQNDVVVAAPAGGTANVAESDMRRVTALESTEESASPANGNGCDDDDDDDYGDLALISTFSHSERSHDSSNSSSSQRYNIPQSPNGRRRVQYSARRRHVVRRTYDSSSSSSFGSLTDFEDDTNTLRRHLMNGADANSVVTVEHKPRLHLSSFKRGLKGAFRNNQFASDGPSLSKRPGKSLSNGVSLSDGVTSGDLAELSPSPTPEAPTPPSSLPDDDDLEDLRVPSSKLKILTEEQRETLTLEQSRLERESRRLKRKPERTLSDDKRLIEIAERVSTLSSTLAESTESPDFEKGIIRPPPLTQDGLAAKKSSHSKGERDNTSSREDGHVGSNGTRKGFFSVGKAGRGSGAVNSALSPVTEDEDSCGNGRDEEVASTRSKAGTPSKRKKGWMSIEMVATFKMLGRSVRNTTLSGRGDGSGLDSGGSSAFTNGKGKSGSNSVSDTGRAGSVYSELGNKLSERGERLGVTAEGAEEMKNDASDMLAATRALRQRQQKGFFQ